MAAAAPARIDNRSALQIRWDDCATLMMIVEMLDRKQYMLAREVLMGIVAAKAPDRKC